MNKQTILSRDVLENLAIRFDIKEAKSLNDDELKAKILRAQRNIRHQSVADIYVKVGEKMQKVSNIAQEFTRDGQVSWLLNLEKSDQKIKIPFEFDVKKAS